MGTSKESLKTAVISFLRAGVSIAASATSLQLEVSTCVRCVEVLMPPVAMKNPVMLGKCKP